MTAGAARRFAAQALPLALGLAALASSVLGSAPSRASAQTALPAEVSTAAKAAVASRAGVAPSDVSVARAEAVTWSDGCLGISEPGAACTQALVEGWVLWLVAGKPPVGTSTGGYRAHTNASGSVIKLATWVVDLPTVPLIPLPSGATARGGGGFKGKVPESGQMALLVTEGITNGAQLASALKASGCRVESVAVILDGRWKVYIEGAPAVVNAQFPASLSLNTAFAVRCL
jgi:hypothetical protein